MVYQKIGDAKGNSDSEGKLERIQLPDLTGKSFLDLGCNMGFFCRAARDRGAIRTVGVDDKRKSIAMAREYDPVGEYLAMDWFRALRSMEDQFDVIIHLSAFHYVTDHWDFLKLVEQRLAPGGVFILECGTVNSMAPRYVYVRRTTFTKHVTNALLKQLLSPFEVRTMGRSVDQSGDPVPRFVYHCYKRRPTALILGGETASGKSYLGHALTSDGSTTAIRMDELIRSLTHCPNPLVATLMQEYFGSGKGLEGVSHAVLQAGLTKEFSAVVADLVPNCFNVVVLEGQVFSDGRMRQAVGNRLSERGFVCWDAGRLMTRDEVEPGAPGLSLLEPNGKVNFHWRASADKLVRPMPVDDEMMLIVGAGKVLTSACWEFPSAERQGFECAVRVHANSRPIKLSFDVLDAGKIATDGIFEAKVAPERSISKVIEGGDRYQRIHLDLPATRGNTLMRVTAAMANQGDPATAARVFIAAPRLLTLA